MSVEAERQAFLARHFHADLGDLTALDLVVNTGVLGIEGSLDAVHGAIARLPGRPSGCRPTRPEPCSAHEATALGPGALRIFFAGARGECLSSC